MHNVKRYFREGQIYFLTLVTYRRKRILIKSIDLWWKAVEVQRLSREFGE